MAAAALLLVASLLVAPLTWYTYDVVECWLPWSRATGGTRPWEVYAAGCNYPPVVPYLLTGIEAIRQALGVGEDIRWAVFLIKLPGILAHVATVLLLYFGLRQRSETWARVAAVAYGLSPALFFNSAVWGQYDSILCLALVGVFLLLLHEKWVWAGACLGLALAIKLQAVIAVPAVAILLYRTIGWRKLLTAVAAGLVVVGLAAAPHVIGGRAEGVKNAYLGATESWPYRTMAAYNVWFLVDTVEVNLLGRPETVLRDDRPMLPGVTYRAAGIALFLGYVAIFSHRLWRLPSVRNAAACAAASFFGFFMLSTQMHERYVLPALPLLALWLIGKGHWRLSFWTISALATLNQAVVMYRHVGEPATGAWNAVLQGVAGLATLSYVAFFVWFSRVAWRDMALPQAAESLPAGREPELRISA